MNLAPEARFPVVIGQCIQAIDYVLEHAGTYHLDIERIVVGGESAGVYYAAFISAISKDKYILRKIGLPEMRYPEFDVKANMFNCGAVDFQNMARAGFPDTDLMIESYTGYSMDEILEGKREEEMRRLTPLSYITEAFPPTFMIYGSLSI